MRKTMAAALLASAALTGCDGNDNSSVTVGPMISSALEFARSLIGSQTCETTTPTEINGREVTSDETAITDLSAVSVGCAG